VGWGGRGSDLVALLTLGVSGNSAREGTDHAPANRRLRVTRGHALGSTSFSKKSRSLARHATWLAL